MGVHSGKFGVVSGQGSVQDWSIVDASSPVPHVSSASQGGRGRLAGVREWTGSFKRLGSTPIVMPGDLVAFVGYTAPVDDVLGSNGVKYSGNALIKQLQATWNWKTGDPIMHSVDFEGDGALTVAEGAAISDASAAPDAVSPFPCKIEYGADVAVSPTVWANIVQAVLTLTCDVQEFTNSSTVVAGEQWKGRRAGNIDWNLAVTVEDDVRASRPLISANTQLRVYTDADSFWQLIWGHVKDYTNLSVSPETGAILSHVVNIEMSGFVGGAAGSVTLPDAGSAWWP